MGPAGMTGDLLRSTADVESVVWTHMNRYSLDILRHEQLMQQTCADVLLYHCTYLCLKILQNVQVHADILVCTSS